MADSEDTLTLLARFLDTLSHEVRTPLSVVTNTLSYLDAPGQEADVARAKERAFLISDILKDSAIPGGSEEKTNINIQKLLDEALWAFPVTWAKRAGEGTLFHRRSWVWLLITEVAQLLDDNRSPNSQIEALFLGEPTLELSLKVTTDTVSHKRGDTPIFSFTDLLVSGIKISKLSALRLDLLSTAFQTELFMTENALRFRLLFKGV